jgi:hypothetical protein
VGEIASLSNRHVAILEFMMANPGMKLGDVAQKFNVSQPWLSQIIHSDAFQRQLAERQNETFNHTVLPLRDKMNLVAHKMLDKLVEANSDVMDVDTAAGVAESMLDRLGFSPKTPAAQVPTHLTVQVNIERERLSRARDLIGRAAPAPLLEDRSDETLRSPERLDDRVGVVSFPRAVHGSQGNDGGAEERDRV